MSLQCRYFQACVSRIYVDMKIIQLDNLCLILMKYCERYPGTCHVHVHFLCFKHNLRSKAL